MKVLLITIITLFSCTEVIAQAPSFDPKTVNFKSAEARKQFDKIPAEAKKVLFGMAPAPKVSAEIKAKGLQAGFYRLAGKYNFEKNSPEWNYHFERITQQKEFIRGKRPGDLIPIKHLRFKGGQALPSTQEIEAELSKKWTQSRINKKPQRRKKRNSLKISESSSAQLSEVSVINKPKCQKSSVAELAMPKDFLVEGQATDMLFFNGSPPFDIATAIGAATQVIIFGDEKFKIEASPYASLPIPCLPFRLISDGKKVKYAQGAEALKNFDANPGSKGTLDPTVKKYLEREGTSE